MPTLRSKYHNMGNKINIALMGVGMARQYILDMASGQADEQIVKDAAAGCAAAEHALLELDSEMARLKSLTYRLIDPDLNLAEIVSEVHLDNARIRILVVDDEEEVCLLVEDFYRKRGFCVDHTCSGEAAIHVIESQAAPHIVILDMYLHGAVDGLDVLRHLKRTAPDTKCVVVTCEDDPERRRKIEDLGPDAILVKPVLPAHLDARINSFVAGIRV